MKNQVAHGWSKLENEEGEKWDVWYGEDAGVMNLGAQVGSSEEYVVDACNAIEVFEVFSK